MKIQILTIEGCDRCEKLKSFLKESGLNYSEIPCESNPKNCDRAEDITGSKMYPMAIIENDFSGKKEIIYSETKFESLRRGFNMTENTAIIPTHSVDGIINWIKNKLN